MRSPKTNRTGCRQAISPASATACWKPASRPCSRAPAGRWPWTGLTWSPSPARRPPGAAPCADPEASWGHRKYNLLRREDELFYGYYLSTAIMMPDENGPAVPELARRATLSSCRHDPVRAFAPVLTRMPDQGIPPGDILADSGYAHPRRGCVGAAAARRRRPAATATATPECIPECQTQT